MKSICHSRLSVAATLLLYALLLRLSALAGVVTNGDFESGTAPWVLSGRVTVTNYASLYRSPSHYLWFGDDNGTDTAYQIITIPASATVATLSFYYNINTSETSGKPDTFTATIRDSNGSILATVGTWSNQDGTSPAGTPYIQKTFDLLPYAGMTIRLYFVSICQVVLKKTTNFRVDDISVQVTLPPPTVQTLAATSVTANSATLNGQILSDGGSPILERRIEWARNTGNWGTGTLGIDYGFFSDATSTFSVSGNTFSLALMGFIPNTGYMYRVWAKNSVGWSDVNIVNVATFATSSSCSYSLDSYSASIVSSAGSGTFKLTAANGCDWTATTADNWIHTSSSGSGNGTVTYTTDTNFSQNPRSGTIVVGAQIFTIDQSKSTPAPDATFATDNRTPQPGQTVRFYATSPITDDAYTWYVDDSLAATGSTAYLTINSAGTHSIKLVVTDSQSRRDTQSVVIPVQSNVSGTGGGGSSGNNHPTLGADPVNLASGSYTYEHTDVRYPGIGIPLEFNRFYNSKFNDQSGLPLGYGWSFAPSIRVVDTTTNAIVTFGDGHAETFTTTGSRYVGDAGVFDLLAKNPDNSWLVITKSQTTNHIDSSGRLVQIQDRNGNAITLDYETDDVAASGRLKQITDTAGRVTFFRGYPSNPALIGSIEDTLLRTNFFAYDANTNLMAVTNAMQAVTKFTYNEKHQLTGLRDNRSNLIVSNIYDPDLNVVIRQLDAYGNGVGFNYDFTNHVTIQTNALSQISIYQFDDQLLLTNQVDEAGFTNAYAYDSARNRILVRDRNGNETHYGFDGRGNVTNKTDALTNITSIEYDARNNPVRRVDALLNTTTFGYDEAGNLTDTTNALFHVSHVRYDHGLPVVLTDPRGISTTNRFDPAGNLVYILNIKGFTNRFEYDGAGRKLRQIDALNRTNSYFYDRNDNLVFSVDPLGRTNFATFDENNNRTSTVDPLQAVTTNLYDLKDRLYLVTDALNSTNFLTFDALDRKTTSVDPRGNTTSYELSTNGYVLSVTNALTQVVHYTYDPNGNQTSIIDSAGNLTTNWFDPLNRRYATVDPLGHTNLTGFDQLGRVIATTNANRQVTQFLYDRIGRLTNVVDAARGNVFFDYDENGNRIRVTDPNGHSWTNRYDELNRLSDQDDPVGHTNLLYYDAVGNLTNRVTPNGASIVYQPDALNRVTNIIYPDATFVTFAFDEAGNRTRMLDHAGTTIWTFDSLHRMTSCTDPFLNTVSNRFDKTGNRTVLTYPGDKEVNYSFDALNRIESLTNWLGGQVHYGFDNRGVLTNIVNSNGTKVDMGYDEAGRMTNIINWSGTATIIASEAALLDPSGNQTNLSGFKPLLPIVHNTNITSLFDADNRLASLNSQAVIHDNDGNLTVLGLDSYRYDFEDRLISYAVADTFGGQHLYDGIGNRIQHTTNGVARRFVLDRLSALTQVLTETDGVGTITAYYIYGHGLAERITPDNKTATYHFDLLGSTVIMTSEKGGQVAVYAYDTFGTLSDSDEDVPQPFRYLGRYGIVDDGNGLYRARARYFSPTLGRFTSKDILSGDDSSSQSFNRYVYALNNPLRFYDASGLKAVELPQDHFWRDFGSALIENTGTALFYVSIGLEVVDAVIPVADLAAPLIGAGGYGIRAGTRALAQSLEAQEPELTTPSIPTVAAEATPLQAGFQGSKGFELQNLQGTRNTPTVIGGRSFSGHALDQMQNRGIMPSVVENTIKQGIHFPGRTTAEVGFYDSANDIQVIVNSQNGNIITTTFGKPTTLK